MCNCEWRDIETAPKDGTEVLLYSNTYGIEAARFYKGKWRTTDGWDAEYRIHWMPLPTPPSEGGK